MNKGWSYGQSRDYELKQHPYLLPVNELPVNEKRFMYSKNEKIFNLIDNYLLDPHKFDKS